MTLLKCQNPQCGKEFEYPKQRKGRVKKYCPECQPIMLRARMERWRKGVKGERGPKRNRYGIVTDHYYEDANPAWIY